MTDTIFVPSFGNRPRNLVGREDVLRIFEDSLQSAPGSRERAILILGQRGSGKTVLLLELAEMAQKQGMVVASPTVVSKEMPERVLEKLVVAGAEFIEKEKTQITGGTVTVLGFGGGIDVAHKEQPKQSFALRLSNICKSVNEHGRAILILIDEAQANTEELRQLIVAYQEMVGAGMDVHIALAGLPMTISSILNDHVLTFLNRASKISLPPLRISDIEAYYRNAFSQLAISMRDDMVITAAHETSGSPYLMQLIGHYITINAGLDGTIDGPLFTTALDRAKTDFINDICQTTLAPLSEQDTAFLAAMATDASSSKIADIAERLHCSASYAQIYKRRLIHAGVIEQSRRGEVQFAVPYLREYLRQTYENE